MEVTSLVSLFGASLLLAMSALRVALNRLSWRVLPLRSAATVRSSQRVVAPAGKVGEMRG